MDFKTAYNFPISRRNGKVTGTKHNMVFDFPMVFLYPNAFFITATDQDNIVDMINGGKKKITLDAEFSYNDSIVYIKHDDVVKEFLIIRGWGYLTGSGGLNLDLEAASKFQDDLGHYITDILNKKI